MDAKNRFSLIANKMEWTEAKVDANGELLALTKYGR